IEGVAGDIEPGAGRVTQIGPIGRLTGEAAAVDALVERVQPVERGGALPVARRLVGKAMKEHARPVEVAQVHLAEHLLWDAAVHRDRKRLWCEVIEGYFLPQPQAEWVREDGQHLVGRVMVDSHEVGVYADRAQKC